MDEMEFRIVQESLDRQINKEILCLREYLMNVNEVELNTNDQAVADAISRIFYAMDGLKKIVSVMEYMDCWEDNGDPPQLNGVPDRVKSFGHA